MSSFGLPLIALFLSTPSARRATLEVRAVRRVGADFYPRPPRGGRQVCRAEAPAGQIISIHALREEGDGLLIAPTRCLCNFYPRPPRGGRHGKEDLVAIIVQFLSTPSARRATHLDAVCCCFFSISIHALREEGDDCSYGATIGEDDFYPRPPRGGRRPGGCPSAM